MRVFICFFVFIYLSISVKASEKTDILVFTVATNNTNGFERYQKSAEIHGIKTTILGFGEKWKGGDNLKTNPGGGWKINLLKKALQPFEGEKDKIILFTDAYDVIFLSDTQKIVEEFQKTGAKVLFGAESFCWPIASLENSYPEINDGKRFLNSGLYIGYISEIVNLLNRAKIEDVDDDQLYFTKAYLDQKFREENGIKLDHKSEIFQNLNGASNDVEIIPLDSKEFKESDISLQKYKLKNVVYQTEPLVIHGNGPSKISLNYIENYFVKYQKGENEINLDEKSENELPTILMALFIEAPTPFIMEQLIKLQALDYPRNKIHLFIHYATKYHTHHVNNFVTRFGDDYQSIKQIIPDDGTPEWTARDLSLDYCLIKKCDYYFAVDSIAHLDNSQVLRLLIEQNRTVVAPMLSRWGKAWSNFWGALTADGFYARSNDYMDIVHRESVGLWNVPFIANCYLIKAELLKTFNRKELTYSQENVDADMAFCKSLRDIDVFMYLTNKEDFGHLVNPDSFDISRTEPDMYQIFDNEKDWEDRYIHPEYFDSLNPDKKQLQPCPDVYWFPIVSETFCHSLINMMERFGKWSSGKNDDERLEGGYEAVPTRDIHMNQVGWEPHWLQFLQKYVRPLQEHVFTGYFHDPPKSLMNFVVRYRPDEQPSLRPHHDSSTYTINIALNRKGVDYQGGGCKFLRYNCSVTDTKQGWMLMHPGRLTHFHEGLLVTEGTRYIMISFVDP